MFGFGLPCLLLAGCGVSVPSHLSQARKVPLVVWAAPAAVSYGTALSATQLNAAANIPGTFVYLPALGTVLAAGVHEVSLTFTPADMINYATVTDGVPLTVNPSTPVLGWPAPTAVSYSTALSATQLDATANVPGTFAYAPAAGAVLTAGAHTLSVTFTPADAVDYAAAEASVPIAVNPIAPVLSWPPPLAISYSTALSAAQLNATANIPGALAYDPASGSLLAAGSHTLSVSFTPSDAVDYATATGTVTLGVRQATPRITWTPSDPIAVNVALGASQLDAAASAPGNSTPVAGTWVYTPEAGTTFSTTGPQPLSVAFFPADTLDYATAEAGITMTVSSFGVVAWGDSLTAGRQGNIDAGVYPTDLRQMIVLPVENLGVNGQTSTEIGVREGGVTVNVSVAGGIIPAAGGVIVTFPTGYSPVTGGGPYLPVINGGTRDGVTGSILGVHGSVTLSSGVMTFTPATSGSAVNAPGTPAFVIDTPYAGYLPVFWEGRNNISQPQQIVSDLAAQVATVPSGQTFLVMGIINFNKPGEWIGETVYNQIVTLNNQLANIYGSHYLDIREVLVSHYDPTVITDVSDHQHDEVPTSLRAILRTGTLTNSIGPADTSFTVTDALGSPVPGDILTIDTGENAENVKITAVDGDTVTVVRNFGGLNTAHAADAPVVETDYIHLDAQGYQVVANSVAQFLSAYAAQVEKQGDVRISMKHEQGTDSESLIPSLTPSLP